MRPTAPALLRKPGGEVLRSPRAACLDAEGGAEDGGGSVRCNGWGCARGGGRVDTWAGSSVAAVRPWRVTLSSGLPEVCSRGTGSHGLSE
jgi:hypothetical protein